ncbi:DNA topoisomerase III [Francisellaceae bacterium CB52]
MRVFIAEKPSQGRDIANVLGCRNRQDGYLDGNNTIVTWGFGHLLQPADPEKYDLKYKKWNLDDLPIIPTTWKLSQNDSSKKQLAIVKNCIAKADEVVIATDADREGELIARLILGYARYNGPVKRLWLSALDDASIRKALNNLKDGSETEPLFHAGLGRQRADWISGFNYTRACSLVYGGFGNVFSVGRVQTPTLRLVVERDLEIANFKSKDFFGIVGIFRDIPAQWVVPEEAFGDEEKRCLDESIVKAVVDKCKGKDANVAESTNKAKEQKAPLCMSLSELQKQANIIYGYDAKKILDIAQALYERHKAATYPRTDCGYLPTTQKSDVQSILSNLKGYDNLVAKCDASFESRVWNDKKVAESSHHAIIPTNNSNVNISAMSEQEKNVYDIVVKYYLAQFMGNYKYNESFIAIECESERFTTKGIVPTVLGWKEAIKPTKEELQDDKVLPKVNQGETLVCNSLKIQNKKTTPPSHYTDATLISAMKNCGRKVEDQEAKEMLAEVQGIGTEATRADVIETLKKREYVIKKGKSILSTEKGKEIIKQLPDELSSVVITAEWEKKLSQIAKGKYCYKEFIGEIADLTRSNVELIIGQKGLVKKFVENPCPKCQNELIRLKSKPPKKGFYWMCSEIKNGCQTFLEDNRGKPTTPKISKIKCPDCGSELKQRDGKKGKWWGCSNYPTCKTTLSDLKGQPQLKSS